MGQWAIIVVAVIALGFSVRWLWRRWRLAHHQATVELARRQFTDERTALPAILLEAASKTGKPRGLSWEQCELSGEPVFAQDRVTRQLYALLGATISFAAIPGGGMEEVEAVGNLRYATAVFVYRDGRWQSDGQVVFNLEPAQALAHFAQSLAPVDETLPPDTHRPADQSPGRP